MDGWIFFDFVSTLSYKLIAHIVYFLAFTAKFHQAYRTSSLNTIIFCRQQSPNLINESWCRPNYIYRASKWSVTTQRKRGVHDADFTLDTFKLYMGILIEAARFKKVVLF